MVRFSRFLLIILILPTFLFSGQPAVQSQATEWQTPQWIPGLIDAGFSNYPYFVVDPSEKVHLFNSQSVQGRYSIVYSVWIVGVGWSNPVDIITSPVNQARIVGAFLDRFGMMYVFFWGGEDVSADIYFTKAPLDLVSRSTAWSTPVIIGPNAITPTTGEVVYTEDGAIIMVYTGNEEGNGLYYVISYDDGATWTDAAPVFLANSDSLFPSELKMFISRDGTIHAVWGLGDESGNSLRVYHAAFDPESSLWDKPAVLATAYGYEADTPSIIEYDDSLFVIYHNDMPTTRFMIRSFDNGKTWTPPKRLFEQVGSNGSAALAIDSANTLHMFFGNRVGNPIVSGVWHSVWNGESWSIPELIVPKPPVQSKIPGMEEFDPTHAQAFVIQGNLLLVIWRNDDPSTPNRHIWYTYRYIDGPVVPANTLVPTKNINTPTVEPTTAHLKTPTVVLPFSGEKPVEIKGEQLNLTLLAGIAPALFIILAIVVLKRKKY